jgi:hypothetical protein
MDDPPKPVSLNYESPVDRDSVARPDRFQGVVWRIVVYTLLFGGIIVALSPPLGRTPMNNRKFLCGIYIHQLLTFVYDYAQKNGGSLPPSLATASSSSQLSRLLVCPETRSAYIYLGRGLKLRTAPSDTILIYEQPGPHGPQGKSMMMVGYKDGSVRAVTQPQADKIIAELKAGHNPPRPDKIQ